MRSTSVGKQNSGMIYLNVGLSDTVYGENARSDADKGGFSWTPCVIGGFVVGGTVAAVAAGGGGGVSGSGNGDSGVSSPILTGTALACVGGTWETRNGVHVCRCLAGYELKNGACIEKAEKYQTADINNSGASYHSRC